MKKILICLLLACITMPSLAARNNNVEFAYDAGAEVVSSFVWRGMYNGGLSFQPNVAVGYNGRISHFCVGVWGNVGASNWLFNEFTPELDLTLNFEIYGLQIGATHYYYFSGSPFFCWQKDQELLANEDASSQTEITIGYNFARLLKIPLYFNWNTMVAGCDFDEEGKRAYSTYVEIGYTQPLPHDFSLGAQVGFSPWKSMYTDYEKNFAVNNISLRLAKSWEWEACELEVFAVGSLNTCNLSRETVFVHSGQEDGPEKSSQKLNGTVGVGVWF